LLPLRSGDGHDLSSTQIEGQGEWRGLQTGQVAAAPRSVRSGRWLRDGRCRCSRAVTRCRPSPWHPLAMYIDVEQSKAPDRSLASRCALPRCCWPHAGPHPLAPPPALVRQACHPLSVPGLSWHLHAHILAIECAIALPSRRVPCTASVAPWRRYLAVTVAVR
jgi:hypothetical protein